MKICIVSSCGGHLTEINQLEEIFEKHNYFYIINDKILLDESDEKKTYFVAHSERDWKFLINLWEALVIFIKEKPTIIISTGAGPAVPFSLIGKYLFNIKIIYIETITSIDRASLTGRIMYYISDAFFYQWSELKEIFPKGKCCGLLL